MPIIPPISVDISLTKFDRNCREKKPKKALPAISEDSESRDSVRSGAATARGNKPRLDDLFRPEASDGQLSGPSSTETRSAAHSEGQRSGPQSAETSDDTDQSKTRVKGHHRGRSVPNKAALMQGAKKGMSL